MAHIMWARQDQRRLRASRLWRAVLVAVTLTAVHRMIKGD